MSKKSPSIARNVANNKNCGANVKCVTANKKIVGSKISLFIRRNRKVWEPMVKFFWCIFYINIIINTTISIHNESLDSSLIRIQIKICLLWLLPAYLGGSRWRRLSKLNNWSHRRFFVMHGILISLYLAFSPFRQTYIFGHCQHSRFSHLRILTGYHYSQPSSAQWVPEPDPLPGISFHTWPDPIQF